MSAATVGAGPVGARPSPGTRAGRLGGWLAGRLHLPVAAVLTAYLGFHSGGYFPDSTGLAAVALGVCVVLRITLAPRPFAGWTGWSSLAAGAAALFACWVLLSGTWSGSAERALTEFDRALLYLLALVFYATFRARPGGLAAMLRWVLLAFTAIALTGLGARLAPDLTHFRDTAVLARLSYPVSYWNGLGVACAIGFVLGLHAASAADEPPWVRVLATATLPVTAAAGYFTFSRGATGAAVIGVVVYVLVARPRHLLPALVVGGIATWLAIRAAYAPEILAGARYDSPAGLAAGHDLARHLAWIVLGAAAARILLLPLERIVDRRLAGRLSPGPWGRAAIVAAAVVLVVGVALAADVPGRVRTEIHAFERGNVVQETGSFRDRFGQAGNNGRLQVWKAALAVFRHESLHGSGAGTFRVEWFQRRRSGGFLVNDAHSLYIETLAELGWPGLVLLATVLLTMLGAAARRALGRGRQAPAAAVLAAGIALCIHAAVDWDWELPVLWIWFFAAGGMLLAGSRSRLGALPRLPRVLAGLVALLVLLTPLDVARSQAALFRSSAAFDRGDCTAAVNDALDSVDALSSRSQPFEFMAWCDLRAGSQALAEGAMRSAQVRDPDNWQYAYGLAVIRAARGEDPRPATALAAKLNPRSDQVLWLERAMRGHKPARWRRAALRATLPEDD